ncbi:MAG: DUF4375 domain-containing protein [Paludibacteraceae bacterium]|jgi:hypothetical protein|nr:DUF4375 domain-containing protein [Paludibacteraceae bacterium]MDD5997092.1 DUF4375 domain-containing protein [Bacteroidales bacterium]MBQ8019193.1 DUF4375 domain-containing protein [Paludibacteraceae bacterium]MBR6111990.1 DUF4375 domain-containing protein [Paludibacteraceae bacterium]MCR5247273.1 DMP19 family protein [Paludibacteraceae bacterium]
MAENFVKIKDSEIKEALKDGDILAFFDLFVSHYADVFKDGYTAEAMAKLNASQHTIWAYHLLLEELDEEGFVGLIQNGFGGYFFKNPVAKMLKTFGAVKTSKLLYKAHDIYAANKEDLERDKSDDDFIASFEEYEEFDPIEEEIIEISEQEKKLLAYYIDEHIEEFAEILP